MALVALKPNRTNCRSVETIRMIAAIIPNNAIISNEATIVINTNGQMSSHVKGGAL